MKIKKTALAGTLESCDIQISIFDNPDGGIKIFLESPVKHLFQDEIENVILQVIEDHLIKDVIIKAIDKGALNCTIAARTKTAIYRSSNSHEIKWEAM